MRHSFLKTAARTNKDSDGDAPAWSAVTGRAVLDLENEAGIAAALDRFRPWAVINAAGWVRVDEAEGAQAACHRVNAAGAIALARASAARGIGCLNVSSDLVFDGSAGRPYVESDLPTPLDAYGRSKAAMEAGCDGLPGVLVVRTAAFFSPLDPHNFAVAVADALAGNQRFAAAGDHVVTPTFVPSLVDAALDLLIDGADGRWHPAGDEALSWANFARRIAMACGYDPDRVDAVAGATLGWRASRPTYAALASERGAMAGSLVNAIEAFASGYHATRRGGAPAQDSGNPGQHAVGMTWPERTPRRWPLAAFTPERRLSNSVQRRGGTALPRTTTPSTSCL